MAHSALTDWGTTAAERASAFDCDGLLADPDQAMWRAVDVAAPPAVTFRWICQIKVAPYSYDWIDNLGRRSPRQLTPGAERLELGEPATHVFSVAAFEPGRSLTIAATSRLIGRTAISYRVEPRGPDASRILAKLVIAYARRSPAAVVLRLVLPAGDLVMMRRQLLNLKGLAEQQASSLGG